MNNQYEKKEDEQDKKEVKKKEKNEEEKNNLENKSNVSKISFKRMLNSLFLESSFSEEINKSIQQTSIIIYN